MRFSYAPSVNTFTMSDEERLLLTIPPPPRVAGDEREKPEEEPSEEEPSEEKPEEPVETPVVQPEVHILRPPKIGMYFPSIHRSKKLMQSWN